jgi:lactoylglutathione lyase
MAGKKKSKKDKKAAKKAKKQAKKAAKRAARERAAGQKAAPAVARTARKAAPKAARKPPQKKAAKSRPASRAARPAVEERRHQPENLRLRSAAPSLTVSDIQKSLDFYRDVLGFAPKERWEKDGVLQGVEMVAGSVTFWLGQDDWKKGRDRVKGVGFRIYCETRQDVDGIAQRIRDTGVSLLEEPKDEPWGGRAFAVTDPDGYTITIASAT